MRCEGEGEGGWARVRGEGDLHEGGVQVDVVRHDHRAQAPHSDFDTVVRNTRYEGSLHLEGILYVILEYIQRDKEIKSERVRMRDPSTCKV